MRGIDLQMAFSLNKQANLATAIATNKIDRMLPYRAFAPGTQEFPATISDKDWYGKGNSFASFWDPIQKQVTLASREYSLSNLSALFAPAMVLGGLVSTQPYSGSAPTVYDHKFTFQDPRTNPNAISTTIIEKMGSVYQRKIAGVVLEQFTLNGTLTDHVTIAWQGFGSTQEDDVTAMPALSPQGTFFKTTKGTFRFGASGGALADISAKLISWQLMCTQNPSKFWLPGNAVGLEQYLSKVLVGKQGASGQAVVLLENMDQKSLFEANTECAFEIVLTGDEIGETGLDYTVTIEIPHLKLPSETFGEEQDQVTYTIPFTEQSILKASADDYVSITVRCDEDDTELLVAA